MRKGIRTTSPQIKKLLGDLEVFIDSKIDSLQYNLVTPEKNEEMEENDDDDEEKYDEEKDDEKGEDDEKSSFIDDSEQADDPDYQQSDKSDKSGKYNYRI